jgi:protocatechuate 3,4-dioxygenase beta subunit
MPSRMKRNVLMGLVVAAAVLLAACGTSGGTVGQTATQTPSPPPAATGGSAAQTATAAGLTVGATEGPYYITGTAELKNGNLNPGKLPGEPIKVSGHVYAGPDSTTPLAGAKVEIWHADTNGVYHPNSNGAATQYSADQLALRGYVLTDKDGYYEFTSIYPGYYQGRTRHIHVRASADGYGGVTTQIIVPPKSGDGTTPETDMIAQSLPESYQVTFTEKGGVQETTFDFHLGAD